MEDDVDTGSTLVRPVEIHHRAQELRPIWNLREMVEKCSYQGMKLRDDIALWNSRLCCGVVSEEQQKLPNLLLHAIFRIGEIVPDGTTVLSPQTPKSWSNVFPTGKSPPQVDAQFITHHFGVCSNKKPASILSGCRPV